MIEMILDARFAAPGDEHEVLDARLAGFVDDMLDDRLVDHRQHFLGHRLGRGQEAGAEPGHREHGFANTLGFGHQATDCGEGERRDERNYIRCRRVSSKRVHTPAWTAFAKCPDGLYCSTKIRAPHEGRWAAKSLRIRDTQGVSVAPQEV